MRATLRRSIPLAAAFSSLAMLVAACGGGSGNSSQGNSVTVGMSTTLSGSIAGLGQSGLNGVQQAIDDLNASGGVNGKQVKLSSADDGATPATGTTNVRNLILNDQAVAIFGPVSSAVAAAEEGLAAQYKIPIFFNTANDLVLTTKQFTKYAFQLVPNTYMEPRALALFLSKQPNIKRIYTIAPDYNYGHDTVDTLLSSLKEFGDNVESVGAQWPPLGASDYNSYISAAIAANPDLIFIAEYGGDLITLTNQAEGYQLFKKTKVMAGFGLDVLPVLKGKTPSGAITYSRGPFFAINTPGVQKFVQEYQRRNNGAIPTEWSLIGYTAVQAWADGAKKAQSFDGDKVAAALSGATVPTIRGNITLRDCDHQAEVPEYVGTVSPTVDPKFGFPLYDNLFVADPQKIMLSCDQVKKMQPSS